MSTRKPRAPRRRSTRPRTLAIDVGGSKIKAAVLDPRGRMLSERVRVETPAPAKPRQILDTIEELIEPLPKFERISLGFPGIVRDGIVYTAPNLGNRHWKRYDFVAALEKRFGTPARILNDAEIQGLGVIRGRGIELVITLGTGFGSSLFLDGRLGPKIQFAVKLPSGHGDTSDGLGDEARKAIGGKRWRRRVSDAIEHLHKLTNFDHLYIGGGNADKFPVGKSKRISIVDNAHGILGGIRLWEL